MRTTVTLDDDIATRVKEIAHRRRTSFKQALNDLIKRGLARADLPAANDSTFVVQPHHGGFRPGVDSYKLNQLNDQLETEAFVRKSVR